MWILKNIEYVNYLLDVQLNIKGFIDYKLKV